MLTKFIVFLSHYFNHAVILILLALVAACTSSKPSIPQIMNTITLSPQALGPEAIAANPKTGDVYIVGDSGHVSIFQEDKLVTTLPVERQVRGNLAIDSEQGWTYVLNERSNSVTVIRGTQVITTLEMAGRAPSDITIEPNSGRTYVVTSGSKEIGPDGLAGIEGNITILKGPEVIGVLSLGQTLIQLITADPINGYVYVGSAKGDVIVIKGLEEVARYKVGEFVVGMDADPRTGDVYVLAPALNNQDLHRFREGKLVESIKVEGERGSVDRLQVHPTTGDVYVLDFVRKEVVVVRPAESLDGALVVYDRVPVGRGPTGLAIDPFTGNVYVTSIYENSVTAIQGTEVLTTYQVGWYPYGIGVNPANGWVYVANTNENSVTILGFE